MKLVLGKNTLEMNEFTENEFLPNFELKFIFFRKFDENHLHSKIRENT